MIVPDNTNQALTIKRVKYRKSESSQPRIAACIGCGGGGQGSICKTGRRMPLHESMFTHDRANVMSDDANCSVRARTANMGAASRCLSASTHQRRRCLSAKHAIHKARRLLSGKQML